MTKIGHEWNAVLTIAMRGVTLTIKTPMRLIMSLIMPIMMMGMLGGSLGQNMADGLGFDFGKFMLVGMIVNMLFMMTMMGMTGLVEDRQVDFTQEMLISPISRVSIVIGQILGAGFAAVICTVGTLIVGACMGIVLTGWQMLFLLILAPLMCLAAGSLAMLFIGSIQDAKTANMAVSFLTMPQMFLAGAIIPIANSTGILWALSRMMPMTYCIDLARAVVYKGTAEYAEVVLFNPLINCTAIIVLTVAFLLLGTWLYSKSETNR
ncbi:MAG: ABC transporter permease [Clostridiales bacterium]|jgi:ABC-2 type transport system permease protein|nr:ABC transporter permease [Clostridiales bacterium]